MVDTDSARVSRDIIARSRTLLYETPIVAVDTPLAICLSDHVAYLAVGAEGNTAAAPALDNSVVHHSGAADFI